MGIALNQLQNAIEKVKSYVDKSINNLNYLSKDNEEEFIPTENYHPATKKYVDDIFHYNINILKSTVTEINRM